MLPCGEGGSFVGARAVDVKLSFLCVAIVMKTFLDDGDQGDTVTAALAGFFDARAERISNPPSAPKTMISIKNA